MSKITWSDVIAILNISDKPVRSPRRLSQDEITDIKAKCNPQYDLTILDLIFTIEGYQEALKKAKEAIQKAKDNYEVIGECEYDITSHLEEAIAEIDNALGGGKGGSNI
jgi:hypothetical protein